MQSCIFCFGALLLHFLTVKGKAFFGTSVALCGNQNKHKEEKTV